MTKILLKDNVFTGTEYNMRRLIEEYGKITRIALEKYDVSYTKSQSWRVKYVRLVLWQNLFEITSVDSAIVSWKFMWNLSFLTYVSQILAHYSAQSTLSFEFLCWLACVLWHSFHKRYVKLCVQFFYTKHKIKYLLWRLICFHFQSTYFVIQTKGIESFIITKHLLAGYR